MRSFYRLFLLLFVLLAAGVSAAQDVELSETFSFKEEASFQYPQGWTLNEDETPISLTSDATRIFINDDAALRSLGIRTVTALSDAIHSYLIANYDGVSYKSDQVEDIDVGGRAAARYTFTDADGNGGEIIAVRFSDGNIGILDMLSLDGDLTEADTALAIAESFDRLPGGHTAASDSTTTTTAASTSSQPAADCMVSTTHADAVRVRVGPGANRTSFAFLPAEQEFKVLGKAQANDDTTWWKLDKNEVAPKKSAAEAWVAELDVEETGDCDAVVDVNAPPLIPIVSAPPATNNTNSGGDTSNSGGAVPGSGTWTINYAGTAPVSCLDRPGVTVQVPINIPSETVSISSPGGSSINFAGDTFISIQPGVYQGIYNSLFFSSVVMTLRVVSDSVIGVELIYNDTVDGTQCSFTINGTATRN